MRDHGFLRDFSGGLLILSSYGPIQLRCLQIYDVLLLDSCLTKDSEKNYRTDCYLFLDCGYLIMNNFNNRDIEEEMQDILSRVLWFFP